MPARHVNWERIGLKIRYEPYYATLRCVATVSLGAFPGSEYALRFAAY